MHHAISKLEKVAFISVDGNRFKTFNSIPHQTIIKGDTKYQNIAAASVLAKTHRDAYMEEIHKEFPMYNWKQNKGYPTKEHREAILRYGPTKYHRKSFRLLTEQLSIEL
jgi:ribonuclease HII